MLDSNGLQSVDGLVEILSALAAELEITPAMALQLVTKRPVLLQARPQDIAVACDLLSAWLGMAPKAKSVSSVEATSKDSESEQPRDVSRHARRLIVQAVCRLPALLDFAPEELSAQAARTAAVLGVDKAAAAAMLCRATDAACLTAIIAMPSNAMRQQLIDIQAVMDSR